MNLVKKLVFILSLLMINFAFLNCVSTDSSQGNRFIAIPSGTSESYLVINSEGRIMHVIIPQLRDFSTLGLIFVESSATYDSNGNIIEGSKITFDMLMREAHKVGADDIINLKIDEIENFTITEEIRTVSTRVTDQNTGSSRVVEREMTVQTVTKTVNYKANAIAIKYTNHIPSPNINITQEASNSGLDIRNIFRDSR